MCIEKLIKICLFNIKNAVFCIYVESYVCIFIFIKSHMSHPNWPYSFRRNSHNMLNLKIFVETL